MTLDECLHLPAEGCELRSDALTRQLYATDASIYQIVPRGVAFPRTAQEAGTVIQAAGDVGWAVSPRGAGTGLVGGALGDGVIVDFARHNRQIRDFNRDARTVRVGAGVVLDELNAFLRPHGLWFGPDVATSSRATLGGMIANDSSGARVAVYGTTAEHVLGLEVVLSDGTVAEVGADMDGLPAQRAAAQHIADQYADAVERFDPSTGPRLLKRRPGYGFARFRRRPGDLTRLIGGSEGTLAGIFSATLNVVPLPARRGLGVIFFASVEDAMQATVELLEFRPAAIEHVDRILFDQTRGQLAFAPARSLLRLDEAPAEAFLIVEFLGDEREIGDQLAALDARPLGLRKLLLPDDARQALVWGLRKSGLALLTGRPGPAKPVTCIEDVAVRPEQLPEYVAGLKAILAPLGVQASYYGHALSGLLHVRPVLDLHTVDGVRLLRQIAGEVSALVKQFRGSIAGEHGVGMARTEYLAEHLGPELVMAHAELKGVFDPGGVMNPGKIVAGPCTPPSPPLLRGGNGAAARRLTRAPGSTAAADSMPAPESSPATDSMPTTGLVSSGGPYRIDTRLRQGAGHQLVLPFEPVLGFVDKDHSFVGNLEQCTGVGQCLKRTPSMCPTFIATGDELMSTRGRANTIRAVLEGRLGAGPSSQEVLDPSSQSVVHPPSRPGAGSSSQQVVDSSSRPEAGPSSRATGGPGGADSPPLARGGQGGSWGSAGADPLQSEELLAALGPCLSCKACKTECPSNVDMALLKAELLHQRHRRAGVPLVDRMIAAADWLGRIGCATAPVSNWVMHSALGRWAMERLFGISARRRLPAYAAQRFDVWFARRGCTPPSPPLLRGGGNASALAQAAAVPQAAPRRVVLWDDTWVRYHEPHIGMAAVAVLERAGFEVVLARGRMCCGRPAFSRGLLDVAARMGRHNVALLEGAYAGLPVVFLEPSCLGMFLDEYRQLKIPGADALAARCLSFEHFIDQLLAREPEAIAWGAAPSTPTRVAIHAHCHARALTEVGALPRVIQRVPGCEVQLLETGCCGMAGAFGMMRDKYELSLAVARPLVEKIRALPVGTIVVASGTSCRHQIGDLAGVRPLHAAEVLARSL